MGVIFVISCLFLGVLPVISCYFVFFYTYDITSFLMQSVLCFAISQCIHLLEQHEDDLTQWYFSDQKENLLDWLCVERVLDENERGTLYFLSLPHHKFDAFDNQSAIIHWSLKFQGIKEKDKLIYIFIFRLFKCIDRVACRLLLIHAGHQLL